MKQLATCIILDNCQIKSNQLNFLSDNCVGKNKNNVIQEFNKKIKSSLPYHTRFGPDWCFGLIKLKYRRSQISSVFELARVVNTSTQKEINLAQLIVDPVSKQTIVQVYDWKSNFEIYLQT